MRNNGSSDKLLPAGWAENVKSAVLHVISLAQFALTYTRGWAASGINDLVRLAVRLLPTRARLKGQSLTV